MFTIVFQRFLPGRQVAESPRPQLFKPDRPRIFRQQFMSFEKKHFYTRCAGLSVICAPNIGGEGGVKFCLLGWVNFTLGPIKRN